MEIGYFFALGGGSHNDPKFFRLDTFYQQFQAFSFFSTRNFFGNRHTFRKWGDDQKTTGYGDFTAQSGALGGNGFFQHLYQNIGVLWENGLDFAVLHVVGLLFEIIQIG